MDQVRVRIGTVNYRVEASAGGHSLLIDEPASLGGADAGPAPYDLLLWSLGACTAITLRMYAQRKQLPLQAVEVALKLSRVDGRGRIERDIYIDGNLTAAQRARLLEIAEKTPVTLTLRDGVDIHSNLR